MITHFGSLNALVEFRGNNTMNVRIHKTRFKELGYWNPFPGVWRFVALEDGLKADGLPSAVGPSYKTKGELLGDLSNYAKNSWGLE